MSKIKLSKMSGKLQNIGAINTNTLSCEFCREMSKNDDMICSYCYSIGMLETFRKNCVNAFENNSKILSTELVDIPNVSKYDMFRFSAHGELINTTHLRNYIRIVNDSKNQNVNFCLFTKRIGMVKLFFDSNPKPKNLQIVYSNPFVNKPRFEIPKYFNKVFNCFTEAYIVENTIPINCGGQKCTDCGRCFFENNENIVNEKIK